MTEEGNHFENVTPINTPLMPEDIFYLGREDRRVAAETLLRWKLLYRDRHIAVTILEDLLPYFRAETLRERLANERRIKLLSVIENEEAQETHLDPTILQLTEVLDHLTEFTTEYDAVYSVLMVYRAHMRAEAPHHIDPKPIVERILRQMSD